MDHFHSLQVIGTVRAGWPSPAEEELIDKLSFDEWLIAPNSFMITVTTDAMQDAGIHIGDIVIFKRGQKPVPDDIVIASIDNSWFIRYYRIDSGKPVLCPASSHHTIIRSRTLIVVGVISAVIRKY